MKPAPFRYHRATTKDDALQLLNSCDNGKVLAGGQSLMPMLNMRYVMVDDLIDISSIDGLAGIRIEGDTLRISAATRQRDILNDPRLRNRAPIFAEALHYVGHLQTRNRGTIGGSLAHMDPAAELVGLAALLEATITVESAARGVREIDIGDFPQHYMTPDIAPDELLTDVRFRLPAEGHGYGFQEFAQRHGDFAIAGTGAILEAAPDGTITRACAVLIGCGVSAIRLADVEKMLTGRKVDENDIQIASQQVNDLDIPGDALVSSHYRKRLARVITERALRQARDTLNVGGR